MKPDPDCKLCKGTGIAKYFDMSRMPEIGEGEFTLGFLADNYGGESICPDCFPFDIHEN